MGPKKARSWSPLSHHGQWCCDRRERGPRPENQNKRDSKGKNKNDKGHTVNRFHMLWNVHLHNGRLLSEGIDPETGLRIGVTQKMSDNWNDEYQKNKNELPRALIEP